MNKWESLGKAIAEIKKLGVDAPRVAAEHMLVLMDQKDLRRLTNACLAEERRRQDEK